jgi:hypothetical protein
MKLSEMMMSKEKVLDQEIMAYSGFYSADCGSIKVNGICIQNGTGDGMYELFITKDDFYSGASIETIENHHFESTGIWIKAGKDEPIKALEIYDYDCSKKPHWVIEPDEGKILYCWVYKQDEDFYFVINQYESNH